MRTNCSGVKSLIEDVELMMGAPSGTLFGSVFGHSGWYWRICWLVGAPFFLAVSAVLSSETSGRCAQECRLSSLFRSS